MNLQLLSLEWGVLALAGLLFFGDLFTQDGVRKRFLGWLSALGLAGLLGFALAQGAPQGAVSAFGGMFVADGLGYVFKVLVLAAALLTALASLEHLDQKRVLWQGEYYFLLAMVTLAMMLMASAGDLLSLYVALEFNTLGFYALVAILKGRSLVSSEAGLKYLILGALASGLLLFGLSLIYGLSGTLALPALAAWSKGAALTPVLGLALAMVLAGFAFKVSLAPFHMWAPDVYQAAPTPITAFLSVASKAAGFAAIIRVLLAAFGPAAAIWVKLAMALMAVTFIWANLVALKQTNLKRLLAYSSVAQAGYLMIGIIAGTELGLQATLFYLLVYLFTNYAAFQVAMLVAADSGRDDIESFSGLANRNPVLALVMLSAMLSLAGIPPFGGFFGKFYLFAAGVEAGLAQGRPWLIGLVGFAVVMSIVSLYYYLVVVKRMYIDAEATQSKVPSSWTARATLAVCAFFILATGILPSPFLLWLKQALH